MLAEIVEVGELHVFLGKDFVVTIRHSDAPDLAAVRRKFENSPELLQLGPEAVLYALLDRVVDESWDPPVTLGVRLVSILNDDTQHVGQAAYVRGLLEH